MARRRTSGGGGGDPVIVAALERDYRLWAKLPAGVQALLCLGDPAVPKPQDAILAIVRRPTFPHGVCTGCGCSAFDPCLVAEVVAGVRRVADGGWPCHWIDNTQTRCSACGPAAPARKDALSVDGKHRLSDVVRSSPARKAKRA